MSQNRKVSRGPTQRRLSTSNVWAARCSSPKFFQTNKINFHQCILHRNSQHLIQPNPRHSKTTVITSSFVYTFVKTHEAPNPTQISQPSHTQACFEPKACKWSWMIPKPVSKLPPCHSVSLTNCLYPRVYRMLSYYRRPARSPQEAPTCQLPTAYPLQFHPKFYTSNPAQAKLLPTPLRTLKITQPTLDRSTARPSFPEPNETPMAFLVPHPMLYKMDLQLPNHKSQIKASHVLTN